MRPGFLSGVSKMSLIAGVGYDTLVSAFCGSQYERGGKE
jgi:hypothetical protein